MVKGVGYFVGRMNTKLIIEKTTNQNTVLNEYFVLIGQLWNMSTKIVL